MPRLRDETHQPDAEPADRCADAKQHARAEPVGHAAGDVGRERRHHHVEPDREPELAARPAELVDHRLEGEPDREARPAADQQHEEAERERKRGAFPSLRRREGSEAES